jgi:hypothetical protein
MRTRISLNLIFPLFLMCCLATVAGFSTATRAGAKKPPKVQAQKQKAGEEKAEKEQAKKLVKVCSLNSIEANREFQRNVQIMQAQRRRVLQLQAELKQAQTETLKKGLEKELELAIKKLEEDNKKMAKAYGFSLNRNYVLVTEKASVFMYVTEGEAAKLEAEQKKSGTSGKKSR